MRIELGGRARLVVGDHVVGERALGGAVARRVLAVLALEQRPVSRHELGDAVWGDALPKTWDTALRGAVHQLRRAVTDADPDRPDIIRTAFGSYQLDPDAVVDLLIAAGDVERAEQALAAGDAGEAAGLADAAAQVLGEPLLHGLEGEWLDAERRRLEPLHVRARLTLSAAATAIGDHARAVRAATTAVEVDPYLEATHRRLMAANAAAGDRAAALLAYRHCREVLAEDLGLAPSEETEAARRSVLAAARPVAPVVVPPSLDTTLPIAGRDAEMTALEGACRDALGGNGVVIAIVGAAGVGKSRLAAEAAAVAHRAGAAVVHGRFDPDDLGAFGAFGEIFGQLGLAWPPPELTGGGGANLDRSVLVDGATTALTAAAMSRGLVAVLDDIHWADRPSLALLRHLAGAGIPRLFVVVTARDDWGPPAVAEVLETVRAIELEPLDASGIAGLVTAWAGQRPDERTAAGIERQTAGNPFFITALLQDLADRGGVDLASGIAALGDLSQVPATIDGLVAAAVGRCGDAAEAVTLSAAVLGEDFTPDLLAAVAGESIGVTAATLERLVHVRVVGQAGSDLGRFRFVHGLVRQSVLAAADPEGIRAAHRSAAAVLRRREPEGSADLLRHLLAAGDEDTLPEVVALGVRIAEELTDRGAPDESIRLLEELIGRLDAAVGALPAERASVLLSLAMAEISVDRLVEGRCHLRGAAELVVALGDPSILRAGVVLLRPPTAAEHDPEMVDIVTRLLKLAPEDSALQITAQCWLAAELGATDPARATALTAEALAGANRLHDPTLQRLAALSWHLMGRAFTPAADRRAVMERLLSLRPPAGKRASDLSALAFLAGDCLELGDRPAAERAVQHLADDTSGFGANHIRWLALRNLVMLRALQGRLDEAETIGSDAAVVAAALPIPEAVTLPVLQLLMTRYHQRRFEELHPLIAAFATGAPVDSPVPVVLGWVEAELGLDSAPATVDQAVTAVLRLPRTAGWIGLLAIALEAAAHVRHPRTAELADLLVPKSGEHVVIVTIAYLGAVDRYLGLAATAAGEHDRARGLLLAALDQHRAMGAEPYIARTEAELAALE